VQEALALAAQVSHPFSLALAHVFTAVLYHLRRDVQACLRHAGPPCSSLRSMRSPTGWR
jgi:hypothetical protein